MSKKNIHTVYNKIKGTWETKREGQTNPLFSFDTKEKAMKKSIEIAKLDRVEHVIHKMDGTISDKDSYGNDPNPPKDKKH